jgi:hypothetical protein
MNDFQTPGSSAPLPARRFALWALLSPALLLVCAAGWYAYQARQPITVSLEFGAMVGEQPLVLNQFLYPNPGGEGSFKIRDFQFFVSNIHLLGDETGYVEPASYHLVRFDNDEHRYRIVLRSVPKASYSRISFSLGIDTQANSSINSIGDLDPNGRMAWNWEVGYKFLLFEGGLRSGDMLRPLVYHIGFDENYTQLTFDLTPAQSGKLAAGLNFQVDILKLFSGGNPVDMARLSNVKFDRQDARRLAENYADMVRLCGMDDGSC